VASKGEFLIRFSLAARSSFFQLPGSCLFQSGGVQFSAGRSLVVTSGQNSSTNQSARATLESRTGGCGFLICLEEQSVDIQDVVDDD
jgi:hypothetical protein